ncbi:MAG: plasma-membrane proton-efflux P-type ATPase, partial [Candidatus Nanopelagicales bacterium]|nr:plasma-membrane proton-efflux P-type ATPase [Candidatus Nanopelagicales bacterium]
MSPVKTSTENKVDPEKTAGSDLEKIPLPDVLKNLEADPSAGLTAAEAQARLAKYGPNALPEKKVNPIRKILGYLTGPIAYMIEAAAIVSAIIGHWEDFAIIFALLAFNTTLDFWQDMKATSALEALKKGLALDATVMRDGKWVGVKADRIVPGDIVKIRLGMIVPADMRLVSGDYASIDQAALTGESLPVSKQVGDLAYSGSVVRQGEMIGVVVGTGLNTYLGRTAKLVAGAGAVSHAQKAMFTIGNFLIILAVILVIVLVLIEVYRSLVVAHSFDLADAANLLQLVLVLLVASIPVAMPAVFSVTMALGAVALSKQGAIVSRLESIEEMAGVDTLCSDKTGTLTKNQLKVGDPILISATDPKDVIKWAALASQASSGDPIDKAVLEAVTDASLVAGYTQGKFVPFDPVTKRVEATLTDAQGNTIHAAKGAPQAILALTGISGDAAQPVTDHVARLAARGYRALGVATSSDGKQWKYLGILPMSDPPRDDSRSTIADAREKGLRVKMVTGDDTAIAKEMAREIGLGTNIIAADEAFPKDMNPDHLPESTKDLVESADGFARVFPQHKYAIVKALQQRNHLVSMTGDGVNDAPALKQADCGVAVSGAVDAARSAAALILTRPGLSTINSAIDEARQIFGRITSYTIYRVALTLDIMFIVVAGTVFFGLIPLTAVMIVIISLLDDIPIMTIAYDNTVISPRPIRWRMPRILSVSALLGVFSIIQSFFWLMIGFAILHHPDWSTNLGLTDEAHLQTLVFLQLVVGGHLLLLITRTEHWFFLRPFPSWQLLSAIIATQVVVVLICGFGWFVPALSAAMIALTWAYNILWMIILGVIRKVTEVWLDGRTSGRAHHTELVHQPLQPHLHSS